MKIMKKAVLLAAVGMLALASCKKEFTCICYGVDEEGKKAEAIYENENDNPIFIASEKRATSACEDLSVLMDSTVICEIK